MFNLLYFSHVKVKSQTVSFVNYAQSIPTFGNKRETQVRETRLNPESREHKDIRFQRCV